jgi:polysaccharide export outer membrane protein
MRLFLSVFTSVLLFSFLSSPLALFSPEPNLISACFLRLSGHALFTCAICEAAAEPEYLMGPEDVLSVAVRERSDLSGTFTVGPEGTVTLPLLGDVKAAGLTPSQLSKELSRKLSAYRVGEAMVTVLQYNSRKIFVVGAVTKPGKYTFSVIPSIWNVLSEAGGPTETALLSAVQVIRAGTGETITVDVRRMLSGEAKEQVKLQPGDTIRVPTKTSVAPEGNAVYVLGEVRSPGSYEVTLARDVVAALLAAGGPTDMAELRKLYIVRKSASSTTTFKINLEKFLKEGVITANPDLGPGDTVTVPRKRTALGTMFSPPVLAALLSAVASVVIITR